MGDYVVSEEDKALGRRLAELRDSLDVKQAAVAAGAGARQDTISRIENAVTSHKMDSLRLYARGLGAAQGGQPFAVEVLIAPPGTLARLVNAMAQLDPQGLQELADYAEALPMFEPRFRKVIASTSSEIVDEMRQGQASGR